MDIGDRAGAVGTERGGGGGGAWGTNIVFTNNLFFKSGQLLGISTVVKKRPLAGHVTCYNKPTVRFLLWTSEAKSRVGRPHLTFTNIIDMERNLAGADNSDDRQHIRVRSSPMASAPRCPGITGFTINNMF